MVLVPVYIYMEWLASAYRPQFFLKYNYGNEFFFLRNTNLK